LVVQAHTNNLVVSEKILRRRKEKASKFFTTISNELALCSNP